MDALSETLRVVQLVGAIFINARFTAPWCYRSPSAAAAADYGQGKRRAAANPASRTGMTFERLKAKPKKSGRNRDVA